MEDAFILSIGLNTADGAIAVEEARKTLRAYGPFNPEHFLLLDGRRLSEAANAK